MPVHDRAHRHHAYRWILQTDMRHINILHAANGGNGKCLDQLVKKATGCFYTHPGVAHHLVDAMWSAVSRSEAARGVTVIDPFSGDARLVDWLIRAAHGAGWRQACWHVTLWDVSPDGLKTAKRRLRKASLECGVVIKCETRCVDTFEYARTREGQFDVVITNPPWELLKPDSRELKDMDAVTRHRYVSALREYDDFLAKTYPRSQPSDKFAGWGTNLARVGVEVAIRLAKPGGLVGIVSPASLLADHTSVRLRQWMLSDNSLLDAAFFPAEARLFGKADVSTATIVVAREESSKVAPMLTIYKADLSPRSSQAMHLPKEFLDSTGYSIPISFGVGGIRSLLRFSELPTWASLEKEAVGLWAGRELDETRVEKRFCETGGIGPFVKGRMIDRFKVVETPTRNVATNGWKPPKSTESARIAWRDVSRPNQKRRMIATLIPRGWVAGNSLGVACFRDKHEKRLLALLGIMSSFPFEFQLRSLLATGHVSLGALRKVHIPALESKHYAGMLVKAVTGALKGTPGAEVKVEVAAAVAYGLTRETLDEILSHFPKVAQEEKEAVLAEFDRINDGPTQPSSSSSKKRAGRKTVPMSNDDPKRTLIPNHYSASLSDLDMQVVKSVPPGGNWKNIPESIPSQRLAQIRISFKEGNGSRSTYYGRLRADMPAYTISTFFCRPGNGCHMHYDYTGGQHRVISQREAARLQSFPDSFAFVGSRRAVNAQIGNAVPPLLSYQLAKALGEPCTFVDLFAGAGGMGLGFRWAGWKPLVANDIEEDFLTTYASQVHAVTVCGDIRNPDVFRNLLETAQREREGHPNSKLWVLGGPPCQGFSTAGNRRSMDDARNSLFRNYKAFLVAVQPDGFVFENVTGLLSMEGGRVYEMVRDELSACADVYTEWQPSAEAFGIPQRRKRVLIAGVRGERKPPSPPLPVTALNPSTNLFGRLQKAVSVEEALADLPPLEAGEDGSWKNYRYEPKTIYQALMRGYIEPATYLQKLSAGNRLYSPGG